MELMAREISNIAFQLKTLGKKYSFLMSSQQGGASHQIFINSHKLVSAQLSMLSHCLWITLILREILWAEPDSVGLTLSMFTQPVSRIDP